MFEKVNKIISEQLGINAASITEDSKIADDLGADSLDIVEMVMAFSDEFGIDIPDEAAENIVTVGDVVNYLKENA